mgnify:CR=1 FL=1
MKLAKYLATTLIVTLTVNAQTQFVDVDGDGFSDSAVVAGANGVAKLAPINNGTAKLAKTEFCQSFTNSGWLYKPASDHTNKPRLGNPMVLFTKKKPAKSSLNVYAAANGQYLCTFKRFNGTEIFGQRYYDGTGKGCSFSGKKLAELATKVSGSPQIHVEAKGKTCTTAFNPRSRRDKR